MKQWNNNVYLSVDIIVEGNIYSVLVPAGIFASSIIARIISSSCRRTGVPLPAVLTHISTPLFRHKHTN